MSTEEHAELSICRDCVILFANGETPGDLTEEECADFLRRVEEGTAGCQITLGSIECEYCGSKARAADPDGTKDCEPWFSWSACDTCGSNLGGNREHAVAWFTRSAV